MSEGMTGDMPEVTEQVQKTDKKTEKRIMRQQQFQNKLKRTLVACFMGFLTGILSFYMCGTPDPATGLQENAWFGFLLLIAGVVFQKHIFIALRIDYRELGGKDWFYQAFMTFAVWFISWTILLTMTVL